MEKEQRNSKQQTQAGTSDAKTETEQEAESTEKLPKTVEGETTAKMPKVKEAEKAEKSEDTESAEKTISLEKPEPAEDTEKSKEEKKEEAKEKAKTSGKKIGDVIMNFLDRRKHNIDDNLRLVSILLAIALLIGMFQPFLGVKFGVSLKSGEQAIAQASNIDIPLVDPNAAFFEANIGDMVMQKQLRDYKVFGVPIGSIELFGINLYDFAKAPFPDFSKLVQLNNTLQGDWKDFLQSEDFKNLVTQFLGEENAANIMTFVNTLINIVDKSSDALTVAIGVLGQMQIAKTSINNSVAAAEGAVNTANGIVTFIILLFVLGIVLFAIRKGPKYLPAIILTIPCAIFLIVGIGVAIANGIIGDQLNAIAQSANDGIRDFLNGQLPDAYAMIGTFISLENINFVVTFKLILGAGYWIIMLCMLGTTFIAYFMPAYRKRHPKTEAPKAKLGSAEATA